MFFNNTESLVLNSFLSIAALRSSRSSQGTNLGVRVTHDKFTPKISIVYWIDLL